MSGAAPAAAPAARAAALAIALAAQVLAQEAEPSAPVGRLRDVVITRQDVFSDAEAAGNWFYGLVNLLHAVTHEEVIAREVWFQKGEELRKDQIEELERNLRAMGLFGEIRAETRDVGDGEVDLLLHTQDQFSLGASASYATVGGVQKFNYRLSESNLLGTGKQVAASVSYSDEGRNSYVTYLDQQLLGTWHTLMVRIGETEEGSYGDVQLHRPFRHLDDPVSYGIDWSGAEEDVDYYRFGESFAAVPLRRQSVALSAAMAFGPRHLRTTFGADLTLRRRDFEPATGTGAGTVHVPGDTGEVELGAAYGVQYLDHYDTVTGLDRLDYVEDLWLGAAGTLRFAGRFRDEDGVSPELQPVLGIDGRAAMALLPHTYLTLQGSGTVHWNAERLQGWDASAAVHCFQRSLPAQTLAGSLTFDYAGENQDLTPQFTLGEDNGLRGYPAREFAGSRFLRLNLEDRIDTGFELLSIHLGAVAFFDAGWVHDLGTGLSLGDAIRSAGVGLRLGSRHLFGSRVVRLDVAWPLDEVQGNHYGVSVSIGSGQVFSYFGNAATLGSVF